MRRLHLGIITALLLMACGGAPAAPSAAPPSAGPSASTAPAGAVRLQPAPANLGCDALQVSYKSAMFTIDPSAEEHVTATTEAGTTLATYWSEGFVGGASADPVVRDPDGVVVVKDGDLLPIPEGAWPRLAGYFVCPSENALYVLLQDPS